MKKKLSLKNIVGVFILILFAGLLVLLGYKVIVSAASIPGELSSIPDSIGQMAYAGRTLEPVQKVTYDAMKYGYMDDLMLAQMDYLDSTYEEERMEEIRAINDLTAMSEKTMDKLAYEKAAEDYEKYKEEARAAALAAEQAVEAKKKAILASINAVNQPGNGNYVPGTIVSGPVESGSGDTASKGGQTAEPVYATTTGASLGTFGITAYCTCRICCGVYSGGNRTASGTVPTANRTIAVDTNVIPFGTKVVINGQVYVAEDRGGAIKGNRIDMFFMTHQEALNWGRRTMEVYLAE